MNYQEREVRSLAGLAPAEDPPGAAGPPRGPREAGGGPGPRRTAPTPSSAGPRFGDFAAHLATPRAVLTHRLSALVEADVLTVVPGPHGHDEYALTGKGLDLWPVVRALLTWGDDYYSAKGPLRLFRHALDNGDVAQDGTCAACGGVPPVADLVVARSCRRAPSRPP